MDNSDSGRSPVTLRKHGDIGVLEVNNPPVNAISPEVISGVASALDAFERDRSLRGLVVYGTGRTFVAGADITIFDRDDFSTQPFNQTLARLESQDRLVVAALHGTALGGGLEFALACHYRVAVPGTRVGLPEITLGIIPGSLGTQRVPRLSGAQAALDMMLSGRLLDVEYAQEIGLIDEIIDDEPLAAGLQFLASLLADGAAPRRNRDIDPDRTALSPSFFENAYAEVRKTKSAYPAAVAVVEAVEAAMTLPFDEGEKVEARLIEACRLTPESKALRRLFFAERKAAKIPGLDRSVRGKDIQKVGVLGAGTMGTGIAMTFANAGFSVVLIDIDHGGLQRGQDAIQKTYDRDVAKGRLTPQQAQQRMQRIEFSSQHTALADRDLVIEAVFEDMMLKSQVWEHVGQICKEGAILASNTSTLDINVLAKASRRPADFVGMHFFSPAHIMRLLEVVRGDETAPEVLASVMGLARKIRKVAVVSGVCYGFIGNRMAEAYAREADFLLLEGATPMQIDQALEKFGMAMGPCRMLDMAGVDVASKVVIEREKAGDLPDDPRYRAVVRRLHELGRMGQKAKAGYYRYEGRTAHADPEVNSIIEELARSLGVERRDRIDDDEIIERLIYPLINEAAAIVDEGIAYRASDIDIVWTAGYGFPDFRGGPVFYGDHVGLEHVQTRMEHYAKQSQDQYGYWDVAPLLSQCVTEGTRLSDAGH